MTVGAMGDDKVVKLTMNDFWCKMLAIMPRCQCIGGWFDKRKKTNKDAIVMLLNSLFPSKHETKTVLRETHWVWAFGRYNSHKCNALVVSSNHETNTVSLTKNTGFERLAVTVKSHNYNAMHGHLIKHIYSVTKRHTGSGPVAVTSHKITHQNGYNNEPQEHFIHNLALKRNIYDITTTKAVRFYQRGGRWRRRNILSSSQSSMVSCWYCRHRWCRWPW